MDGVGKTGPVPNTEPPVATLYHLKTPALAVACKVTEPLLHLDPGVVVATVGTAVTVIYPVWVTVSLPL